MQQLLTARELMEFEFERSLIDPSEKIGEVEIKFLHHVFSLASEVAYNKGHVLKTRIVIPFGEPIPNIYLIAQHLRNDGFNGCLKIEDGYCPTGTVINVQISWAWYSSNYDEKSVWM